MRPNEPQSRQHLWMLINFLEDGSGEVFGNRKRQATSPKNRRIALHFPAVTSTGMAEASGSKSSVFTRFALASSSPPDLQCILHFMHLWIAAQKAVEPIFLIVNPECEVYQE